MQVQIEFLELPSDLAGEMERLAKIDFISNRSFSVIIPGKLAAMNKPGNYAALDDDLAFLKEMGVGAIVTLTDDSLDRDAVDEADMNYYHEPIADMQAPSIAQTDRILDAIELNNAAGRMVVIHCYAGHGRTGTIVAAYLITKGMTPKDAMVHTRALRPHSIESAAQEDFLVKYAKHLGMNVPDEPKAAAPATTAPATTTPAAPQASSNGETDWEAVGVGAPVRVLKSRSYPGYEGTSGSIYFADIGEVSVLMDEDDKSIDLKRADGDEFELLTDDIPSDAPTQDFYSGLDSSWFTVVAGDTISFDYNGNPITGVVRAVYDDDQGYPKELVAIVGGERYKLTINDSFTIVGTDAAGTSQGTGGTEKKAGRPLLRNAARFLSAAGTEDWWVNSDGRMFCASAAGQTHNEFLRYNRALFPNYGTPLDMHASVMADNHLRVGISYNTRQVMAEYNTSSAALHNKLARLILDRGAEKFRVVVAHALSTTYTTYRNLLDFAQQVGNVRLSQFAPITPQWDPLKREEEDAERERAGDRLKDEANPVIHKNLPESVSYELDEKDRLVGDVLVRLNTWTIDEWVDPEERGKSFDAKFNNVRMRLEAMSLTEVRDFHNAMKKYYGATWNVLNRERPESGEVVRPVPEDEEESPTYKYVATIPEYSYPAYPDKEVPTTSDYRETVKQQIYDFYGLYNLWIGINQSGGAGASYEGSQYSRIPGNFRDKVSKALSKCATGLARDLYRKLRYSLAAEFTHGFDGSSPGSVASKLGADAVKFIKYSKSPGSTSEIMEWVKKNHILPLQEKLEAIVPKEGASAADQQAAIQQEVDKYFKWQQHQIGGGNHYGTAYYGAVKAEQETGKYIEDMAEPIYGKLDWPGGYGGGPWQATALACSNLRRVLFGAEIQTTGEPDLDAGLWSMYSQLGGLASVLTNIDDVASAIDRALDAVHNNSTAFNKLKEYSDWDLNEPSMPLNLKASAKLPFVFLQKTPGDTENLQCTPAVHQLAAFYYQNTAGINASTWNKEFDRKEVQDEELTRFLAEGAIVQDEDTGEWKVILTKHGDAVQGVYDTKEEAELHNKTPHNITMYSPSDAWVGRKTWDEHRIKALTEKADKLVKSGKVKFPKTISFAGGLTLPDSSIFLDDSKWEQYWTGAQWGQAGGNKTLHNIHNSIIEFFYKVPKDIKSLPEEARRKWYQEKGWMVANFIRRTLNPRASGISYTPVPKKVVDSEGFAREDDEAGYADYRQQAAQRMMELFRAVTIYKYNQEKFSDKEKSLIHQEWSEAAAAALKPQPVHHPGSSSTFNPCQLYVDVSKHTDMDDLLKAFKSARQAASLQDLNNWLMAFAQNADESSIGKVGQKEAIQDAATKGILGAVLMKHIGKGKEGLDAFITQNGGDLSVVNKSGTYKVRLREIVRQKLGPEFGDNWVKPPAPEDAKHLKSMTLKQLAKLAADAQPKEDLLAVAKSNPQSAGMNEEQMLVLGKKLYYAYFIGDTETFGRSIDLKYTKEMLLQDISEHGWHTHQSFQDAVEKKKASDAAAAAPGIKSKEVDTEVDPTDKWGLAKTTAKGIHNKWPLGSGDTVKIGKYYSSHGKLIKYLENVVAKVVSMNTSGMYLSIPKTYSPDVTDGITVAYEGSPALFIEKDGKDTWELLKVTPENMKAFKAGADEPAFTSDTPTANKPKTKTKTKTKKSDDEPTAVLPKIGQSIKILGLTSKGESKYGSVIDSVKKNLVGNTYKVTSLAGNGFPYINWNDNGNMIHWYISPEEFDYTTVGEVAEEAPTATAAITPDTEVTKGTQVVIESSKEDDGTQKLVGMVFEVHSTKSAGNNILKLTVTPEMISKLAYTPVSQYWNVDLKKTVVKVAGDSGDSDTAEGKLLADLHLTAGDWIKITKSTESDGTEKLVGSTVKVTNVLENTVHVDTSTALTSGSDDGIKAAEASLYKDSNWVVKVAAPASTSTGDVLSLEEWTKLKVGDYIEIIESDQNDGTDAHFLHTPIKVTVAFKPYKNTSEGFIKVDTAKVKENYGLSQWQLTFSKNKIKKAAAPSKDSTVWKTVKAGDWVTVVKYKDNSKFYDDMVGAKLHVKNVNHLPSGSVDLFITDESWEDALNAVYGDDHPPIVGILSSTHDEITLGETAPAGDASVGTDKALTRKEWKNLKAGDWIKVLSSTQHDATPTHMIGKHLKVVSPLGVGNYIEVDASKVGFSDSWGLWPKQTKVAKVAGPQEAEDQGTASVLKDFSTLNAGDWIAFSDYGSGIANVGGFKKNVPFQILNKKDGGSVLHVKIPGAHGGGANGAWVINTSELSKGATGTPTIWYTMHKVPAPGTEEAKPAASGSSPWTKVKVGDIVKIIKEMSTSGASEVVNSPYKGKTGKVTKVDQIGDPGDTGITVDFGLGVGGVYFLAGSSDEFEIISAAPTPEGTAKPSGSSPWTTVKAGDIITIQKYVDHVGKEIPELGKGAVKIKVTDVQGGDVQLDEATWKSAVEELVIDYDEMDALLDNNVLVKAGGDAFAIEHSVGSDTPVAAPAKDTAGKATKNKAMIGLKLFSWVEVKDSGAMLAFPVGTKYKVTGINPLIAGYPAYWNYDVESPSGSTVTISYKLEKPSSNMHWAPTTPPEDDGGSQAPTDSPWDTVKVGDTVKVTKYSVTGEVKPKAVGWIGKVSKLKKYNDELQGFFLENSIAFESHVGGGAYLGKEAGDTFEIITDPTPQQPKPKKEAPASTPAGTPAAPSGAVKKGDMIQVNKLNYQLGNSGGDDYADQVSAILGEQPLTVAKVNNTYIYVSVPEDVIAKMKEATDGHFYGTPFALSKHNTDYEIVGGTAAVPAPKKPKAPKSLKNLKVGDLVKVVNFTGIKAVADVVNGQTLKVKEVINHGDEQWEYKLAIPQALLDKLSGINKDSVTYGISVSYDDGDELEVAGDGSLGATASVRETCPLADRARGGEDYTCSGGFVADSSYPNPIAQKGVGDGQWCPWQEDQFQLAGDASLGCPLYRTRLNTPGFANKAQLRLSVFDRTALLAGSYWILPNGKLSPRIQGVHMFWALDNPDEFGVTERDMQDRYHHGNGYEPDTELYQYLFSLGAIRVHIYNNYQAMVQGEFITQPDLKTRALQVLRDELGVDTNEVAIDAFTETQQQIDITRFATAGLIDDPRPTVEEEAPPTDEELEEFAELLANTQMDPSEVLNYGFHVPMGTPSCNCGGTCGDSCACGHHEPKEVQVTIRLSQFDKKLPGTEELNALAIAAKDDEEAMTKLYDYYLSTLESAVYATLNNPKASEIEDAVGAASVGLVNAVKNYDPSQGNFKTFAYHYIRGEILNQTNRGGKHRREKQIDTTVGDGDGEGGQEDFFSSQPGDAPLPGKELFDAEQQTALYEALELLDADEATALTMLFGLEGTEPKTLEEIGAHFDMTKEAARLLVQKALQTMARLLSDVE